ncbi:MAG TPA: amino acid racemase, partial [Novosphingobium sp.]
MSWLSTRTYYDHINRLVQRRVGPQASAPMIIESLDYTDLQRLQTAEEWQRAGAVLADSARRLEAAGATAVLIASNAMHKVYDQVAAAVGVPVLHIADAVGAEIRARGMRKVGLLGTRFTLEEPFYLDRLAA